jgi:hypothetical protein
MVDQNPLMPALLLRTTVTRFFDCPLVGAEGEYISVSRKMGGSFCRGQSESAGGWNGWR